MTWEIDPTNRGTGLPLEGVRILDFSRVLAGPLCAMIAGDLGADVIKVESPDGDPVRALAPPTFGPDATYYLAVNRHRRNIVADLKNPDDFARVLELVRVADAIVENFLPSQIESLNIAALRAANPDAVWVSVTPASTGGPLADQPSFDLLAQARSGLMGVTGSQESGPTKVGSPLADVVTGLYGAIGLLTGLYAKAVGRATRHIEAPLLESTMSALINQAQGFLARGVNPRRLGNDHPSIAPYGPVRAADGYLLIAVGTDGQFAKLKEVLAPSALDAHSEWATNDQRVKHRDELSRVMDEMFGLDTVAHWVERLASSGVPHAPILDVAGAFGQPQISEGDFVQETTAPGGLLKMMATPLRLDGKRPPIRRGPRRQGEDTDDVMS